MKNHKKVVVSAFLVLIGMLQSIGEPQSYGFELFPVPYSQPFASPQATYHDENLPSHSSGSCRDVWSYQTDNYGGGISGIVKIKHPNWQSSYIQVTLTLAAQLHQVSDSNFESLIIVVIF